MFLYLAAKRSNRGNMNGKMNAISFCSRFFCTILFIPYQFSPLLLYAHFNPTTARVPVTERERCLRRFLFQTLPTSLRLTSSIRRSSRVYKQDVTICLESLRSIYFYFFLSSRVIARDLQYFSICIARTVFLFIVSHDIFALSDAIKHIKNEQKFCRKCILNIYNV